MSDRGDKPTWHRIADLDAVPEGRVQTVTADLHSMALTHIDGEYIRFPRLRRVTGRSGKNSVVCGSS